MHASDNSQPTTKKVGDTKQKLLEESKAATKTLDDKNNFLW